MKRYFIDGKYYCFSKPKFKQIVEHYRLNNLRDGKKIPCLELFEDIAQTIGLHDDTIRKWYQNYPTCPKYITYIEGLNDYFMTNGIFDYLDIME